MKLTEWNKATEPERKIQAQIDRARKVQRTSPWFYVTLGILSFIVTVLTVLAIYSC